MIVSLFVAIAPGPEWAAVADGKPVSPIIGSLSTRKAGAAWRIAAAGLRDRLTSGWITVDHGHGSQREPRSIDRMDHEVIGRQRAEPGRGREALQREERARIAAMSVVEASARKRGIDHLLGVAVERIALGGECRIAQGRGERRPQRARVADQDPEASLAGQDREPRLAREGHGVERVRDVEAGRVEDGERVHAVTMAQSPRARAPPPRTHRAQRGHAVPPAGLDARDLRRCW